MKTRYILAAAGLLVCAALGAQGFDEAFLLKDYRMNYRYNPAMTGSTSFLSLGRFNSGQRNNVGAAAFLYPLESGLATGLHPDVPAATFLGALPESCSTAGTIDYNLLSYGFASGAGFHTIDVSVRGSYGASVPSGLFKIAKLGTADIDYDLSSLRAFGNAYAEIAYGYSHKIGDFLSVGGRAKLLVGLAAADLKATRLDVGMSGTEYTADMALDMNLTSVSTKILYENIGQEGLPLTSAKHKWGKPCGIGAALDLGIEFTPIENLSISASVLDIGTIFWYYGNAATATGQIHFDGLHEVGVDQLNSNSLKEIGSDLIEQALGAIQLHSEANNKKFVAIPIQASAGIKYSMPFYDRLTLGATGRYVWSDILPYWEARGGIGLNPCSWLDMSATAGYGSYGFIWGAAAAVRVLKFRITAGLQNGIGGTIPYTSTPLKANDKVLTLGVSYDL